ncbi:CDP-alcohol phosphatidyltransferase family protein [Arthrobacter sp. zg-Y1143]|uniref:CDP-alcohol phosphatidyltransferase family protein n=1 Tax=Arthrobacter sp. zg-Y1143 TaxID=3049065 RepID=UPI0024C44CFB|nr:CDP-alcohol phosphatidyltransferase family protein [Arthrobacter sp. zg-Y1143]MDK1328944.1 CDP-alcohol phosphatidyltransferase family protein [Arthrobacter sp. zg-Y1143]
MIRLIGAGTRPDTETTVTDGFWTVPNLVTVLRFLGIPLFVCLVAQDRYGSAFITLVAVGCTDWIDGYLARRLNQVSRTGQWLDPVADRLALIIVAATFVVDGIAPVWLILSIAVPDAVLTINSLLLFTGSPDLPVSVFGKIRTALLLLGAPLLLLDRVQGYDFQWLAAAGTTVLAMGCIGHVAAAAGYLAAAWDKYRLLRGRDVPAGTGTGHAP